MSTDELVKVNFRLDQDAEGWPPVASESVWAKPTVGGLYRIENVPFFVRGLSLGDEVRATLSPEGRLAYIETVTFSDHTTVRIIVFRKEETAAVREAIVLLGCSSELADMRGYSLIAVDVPGNVDYAQVHALLDAGFAEGRFDYQESALRHAG